MDTMQDFAGILRSWRQVRGLSQMQLALEAGVSQRHVSFLELGRTAPSRAMVIRLGQALNVPLREQNVLLLAAGFAPIWRQSKLDSPRLAMINRALDLMLEQHEPLPAFVIDRCWRLLRANEGGRIFAGFLMGGPPFTPDPESPINLADAFMAPDGMRPLIVNWEAAAGQFLRTVRADALADGTAESRELLDRLLGYPDAREIFDAMPAVENPDPVLTMTIAKDDIRFELFTTLATLGTPLDVTAQDIRIECFFPADAASAVALRRLTDSTS